MSSSLMEARFSDLELAMTDMAHAQAHTSFVVAKLADEMKDFKDEMKDFKDEMKDFKDEMKDFKTTINQQWGNLARSLGTVVEDIVAPNIAGVLSRHFGIDKPQAVLVRAKKWHPLDRARQREFDVIAVSERYLFVNETKATLRPEYVMEFAANYAEVGEFWPEYSGRTVVPIMSSLSMGDDVVKLLTRNGIFALVMNGDTMRIVNFDAVSADRGIRPPTGSSIR